MLGDVSSSLIGLPDFGCERGMCQHASNLEHLKTTNAAGFAPSTIRAKSISCSVFSGFGTMLAKPLTQPNGGPISSIIGHTPSP